MTDLIGRFLNFDDHLGRGLVKFAYYVCLFYVVVTHLFSLISHLIDLDFGSFLLVPFQFLLWILLIRVAAEVLIAILSIDDHLQGKASEQDGFEAGLTPETTSANYAFTRNAASPAKDDETDNIDAEDDEEPSPKGL